MLVWLLNIGVAFAMDPNIVNLLTPLKEFGEACGYEGCPAVKEHYLNVHIVPHTHAELGYTGNFYEHYLGAPIDGFNKRKVNMKKILDAVITELWVSNTRTFTISDSEIPYFFYWWSRRDATVRRMVYQLVRQGRLWFVGGGWGMVDTATTSYHAVIDSYTYALRKLNATFLRCGRPLVSFQSDVMGHSKEFASLIALMGFDGLFLSPISTDDELQRMQRNFLEFVWRGSDDLSHQSDVFTHKLFDGFSSPPGFCFSAYCTASPLIITSDSLTKNVDERVEAFISAVRYRQSAHYSTSNVLVVMGHRFAFHDAKRWFTNIDKLINNLLQKEYKTKHKVNAFYSSPACYLDAVRKFNPKLETKQDDFLPFSFSNKYVVGLYTSRPTLKLMAREGHLLMQIVKQLNVISKISENTWIKYYEEMNWIMGILQDHNVITGTLQTAAKRYYTWRYHRMLQRSASLFSTAISFLRFKEKRHNFFRCSFNTSSCAYSNVNYSYHVLIYNPLSWRVTVPVRLPTQLQMHTVFDPAERIIDSFLVKNSDHIMRLPDKEDFSDHELVFIAKDLPGLGYRGYYIQVEQNERASRSLNKYITKYRKKLQTDFNDDLLDLELEDSLNEMIANAPKSKYYNMFDEVGDDILRTNPLNSTKYVSYYNTTEDESYIETSTYMTVNYTTTEKTIQTSEPTSENTYSIEELSDFISKKVNDTSKYMYNNQSQGQEADFEVEKRLDVAKESRDRFIENEHITITINKQSTKITQLFLRNGINMSLDIQFYYYVSKDTGVINSAGPYVFKPFDKLPVPVVDYIQTTVYKSKIVEEIHVENSDWISYVVRLYEDSPVVEVDWIVGPVPHSGDDDYGKDVFVRYKTDVINEGVFFTDANGRQFVKRIRNNRASYVLMDLDEIAGNFYPVTSKIYIEDLKNNVRFSVFNDRAQAGTSLYDGEIDLMVHRRLITDDNGEDIYLDETYKGKGIVVRGKHYLYVTKASDKSNKIFEKIFAKELELKPQAFVPSKTSSMNLTRNVWKNVYKNEYSAIARRLPIGVHLLTLESWNDNTLLIRFENFLEKSDTIRSGGKRIFLKDLLTDINIKHVRETTLGGHIWFNEFIPFRWNVKDKFLVSFNDFYGNKNNRTVFINDADDNITLVEVNLNEGIILKPQQIRTFVVELE